MKFTQTEKKQLLIYVIIAYGITYVLGLLMWYAMEKVLISALFQTRRCCIRSRCDDGLFNYQKG